MRKIELEQALQRRLKLAEPLFKLQKLGSKIAGSVVSDTFKRKTDSIRQEMIWDAIEEEFGAQGIKAVGTILAYTWDEWDIELPARAG